MKIYGIVVNGGDGSYSMAWYKSKKIVERLLMDDNECEWYGCNEGGVAQTIDLPEDVDEDQLGISFSDLDVNYEILDVYEETIKELTVELANSRAKTTSIELAIRATKLGMLDKIIDLPENTSNIVFSDYWECEDSPLSGCVYNTSIDPCMDRCLICHEPHERK